MNPDQIAAEKYIAGLSAERSAFLDLHRKIATAHPEWVANGDARSNLVAKPVNLLLIAIVNMRLCQNVIVYIEFWRTQIDNTLTTGEAIGPSYFEQNTFYRFGFFQFLLSNIEHGFRAISPQVLGHGVKHSDQPWAQVYSNLFTKVLPKEKAAKHTLLFDFLRLLRNTIHNNGVYHPTNGRDAEFRINRKTYKLVVDQRVEYFGWEYFIDWLAPIREAIDAVLAAPEVASVAHISDIANAT